MPSKKFSGKRVYIALFSILFFTSCSPTPRQWKLASNKGTSLHFCSSRLYLAPENNFTNLEVDILNTSQGKTAYLNAFGIELEPEGKSTEGYDTITVTVNVDGHPHEFIGFLLQGGHRILLPDNAQQLIVEALHSDQTVEVTVAHYSTIIIPDNFVYSFNLFSTASKYW